jgi:Bacterial transglutaminase-like cysteine proteinase BTLCP
VSIANEGKRHEGLVRIGHLNRAANFAIRPHADDHPWQSSQGNSGDCKNYAVLKYAMLRELGVSPDALKIIVVEVRSSHQLLLDNRTLMLVESSMALEYYDPLYELDQNGIREFALPTRSTRLAQSLRPTRTP